MNPFTQQQRPQRNKSISKSCAVVQVWMAIGWAIFVFPSTSAMASLVHSIPNVTAIGDGTNPTTGTFDLILNLTGSDATSPPDVSSYNIDFSAVGPNSTRVKFGPVTTPVLASLFPGDNFFVFASGSNHVQVADDLFSSTTTFSPSFDGVALVSVSYEVETGFFGSISLDFGSSLLNELTDAFAQPLPINLNNGSLTVAVVPEPSSALICSLVAIGLVFWELHKKRCFGRELTPIGNS